MLSLLGTVIAQNQPPPPSNNPLLRPKPSEALPIPPLPAPAAGTITGGSRVGLAPKKVFPIPLNIKECYDRLQPLPSWGQRDTLWGSLVFEITTNELGAVTSHRLWRFSNPELVEPYRALLPFLRCAPQMLDDKPEKDGKTLVSFVWPLPKALAASANDSLPPDVSAQPVNLDQVRQMIGYPLRARALRLEGRVVVRVLVNEFGTYVRHRVLATPDPILTQAVEDYIYLLRFIPAFRGRKPVRTWLAVPIDFKPV